MTVLKGSFTFHSHTVIFTGWKPSKIFFFFNDTLCFFPFWQQNIVTNTNPPPFTVFFREQHKYQIHPTRAYCEEKQDVIVTEAKALMCPPSEIP